ncbi:hypothetical protein ACS0TY_021078 [Phlomoides rotata]
MNNLCRLSMNFLNTTHKKYFCYMFKIGKYYLCDNEYTNSPGFLSPYRSVRYHLSEWAPQSMWSQTYQEHFNMHHTRARNVIERAFDIIKMCWGILRPAVLYPIQTQIRLIMACFLLHDYILNEMSVDPAKALFDTTENEPNDSAKIPDLISTIESTIEWFGWRDTLAQEMFQEFVDGV